MIAAFSVHGGSAGNNIFILLKMIISRVFFFQHSFTFQKDRSFTELLKLTELATSVKFINKSIYL